MDGERVAVAATFTYVVRSKACLDGPRKTVFKGRIRRAVPPERGRAEVSASQPDELCRPELVDFTADEGSDFTDWDGALSYHWSFGDGGTSAARRPRHAYFGPGSYQASVTIRGIDGSVATGSNTIEIGPEDPEAGC